MRGRRSLQELVQEAGISPVQTRQPCLPAPQQPAIVASEEDHTLARELLVEQRRNDPDYKDPGKQLKRIFRSSKEKEKLQDTAQWQFTQEEVDRALSAVIDKPTTGPGLVQAFISLGAKVNYVDTPDKKKTKGNERPNASARRRSTVLQRAATLRRADEVSLLASSGADQTTLDEGLKAALAAKDYPCIQELLRHGADINKFPNALADAVRANDQNLVRLLLRAPKALHSDILSSCLPAAAQAKSETIISLLIGYGANPNFNDASALSMSVLARDYRAALALVAGPIALTQSSLVVALQAAMNISNAQELHQFLQLLFCCRLPGNSLGLPGLLVAASKRNDTALAHLLIENEVTTTFNEAECLRHAISNSNWDLTSKILETAILPAHASVALAILPNDISKAERLRIIGTLVHKGANGPPLGRWLLRAVEEGDTPLTDLLVTASAAIGSDSAAVVQAAIVRKDMHSLRKLLNGRIPPHLLAKAFPLLRQGYTVHERLESTRLLLQHGARGPEVDQALVEAIADTSSLRDTTLIEILVQHGADVNSDGGKSIQLATTQGDVRILQMLRGARASTHSTASALPLIFGSTVARNPQTLKMVEILLSNGIEEGPALQTLHIAVNEGPSNLDIIDRFIAADSKLLGPVFQYASALADERKKAPMMRNLLEKGVPQVFLDDALLVETRHTLQSHDTTILRLLLEHGASMNFHDGESLSTAVCSNSITVTKLLLSSKEIPSKPTITKAFRSMFQHLDAQKGGNIQFEIAEQLLALGVEQVAIDSALRTILDDSTPGQDPKELVDLLLRYHANVNTADGTCFVFAARRKDYGVLGKLLSHNPDFSNIVPALLKSKLDEDVLTESLHACFESGCQSDQLERPNVFNLPALILALQNYPRSSGPAELLLHNGCNPNITVRDILEPAVGEESMTALLWALAQPQKTISTPVIRVLLRAGASPTRASSGSDISPIHIAARESRVDIVEELLNSGADPSVRDKWNRSALFSASSGSITSTVEILSAHALKDDGSLHEAARNLQLDHAKVLLKHGHHPNFPSRLHGGRNALGELCLNAEVTSGLQRTRARQLMRLFLDNGANPKFKARNERSTVVLALDNPHSALEVTDAVLETEVWQDLNDEKHMFRDSQGLWYSPLKLVELVPSNSRVQCKLELIELLRDKGCEPRYYSEHPQQPDGAVGMPQDIKQLADRQKQHQLSLQLAKEASEHTRMLEEASHRDILRRKQEQQDTEMAAAAAVHTQWAALSQQKHDTEMGLIRSAERTKRTEKVAWHGLQMQQEADAASKRLQIEDRKVSAAFAHEAQMAEQRKAELEYRTGVERRALMDKEQMFERNVNRQKMLTERMDESAQLHARLRQDRPAIEGAPQWGSVD
ncbi:hypothetical protein EJ04DRAFT_477137 [Polyplosphaeria fusca]|uniref:Uncharacterized protein n=1 Tax=Polyplosphaeria fusca TaxID=682080 RepID=A0A9P4QLA1_9PLEO|nr:hypothetical protein EJ04DRAFT_477137 [Polyplosphaeria fusca]